MLTYAPSRSPIHFDCVYSEHWIGSRPISLPLSLFSLSRILAKLLALPVASSETHAQQRRSGDSFLLLLQTSVAAAAAATAACVSPLAWPASRPASLPACSTANRISFARLGKRASEKNNHLNKTIPRLTNARALRSLALLIVRV